MKAESTVPAPHAEDQRRCCGTEAVAIEKKIGRAIAILTKTCMGRQFISAGQGRSFSPAPPGYIQQKSLDFGRVEEPRRLAN